MFRKPRFSESRKPSKILIIASTGRCGSHMLGHALYKTGSFGFPLEYTNPSNFARWKRRFGIDDFQGIMTEIQQRRTSPNGVFGIKIHYPHIKQFGGFDNLVRLFPNAHYVLLSRKDVLKQAVSLSIARQTGVWISGQKPVNENPTYDFEHIDKCLRETILNNSSWRYTLAASGCNYIEMDFDHVRNNLFQSIEKIASFIGIEIESTEMPKEQATKKQSKYINKEWAMKFISDFNKADELLSNKGIGIAEKIKGKVKRLIQA
ncbi:Stf0 family sulfotransferase [Marinobacter changyiensis]|uniref:Stf0 family sulfotransferase n=1 Tax=Marinobacter changyiensis TaxID=2604091 RepID=UPI0031B586F1